MSKKKTNKSSTADNPQAEQKAAKQKPTKKEKRAMAEQRSHALRVKRKRVSIAAMVVAGTAVAINFSSNSYYGQPIYDWIQVGCFLLMAIAGGIFMYGARFEETEAKQRSKRAMGIIFVVIALSVILMEGIPLLMQ